MTTAEIPAFTIAELDALGVSTDIRTASRALGISGPHGYRIANRGEFPVPILHIGGRWVVPTAGIRQILGL